MSRLAHWNDLVDGLATATIVAEVSGRILIWNRAAADFYGYGAGDVLGRPLLELLPSADADLDTVAVLSSVASGRSWLGEVECRKRDRTVQMVTLAISPTYDDDHIVNGFVCESFDPEDQRASVRQAKEAEWFFRALLTNASEVSCITDARGVVKYSVQSKETSLGYSPDEVKGKSGFDFVHPDDVALLTAAFAAVLETPTKCQVVVYRARVRDGAWRWRETRLSNYLSDPVVRGIVCNIADVTEQQELIRELRGAGARQNAILARSRDATLFFDPDGTIRWASAASEELLGMEPEQLVGRNGLELIHPADRERVLAEFATMIDVGSHVRTEFRVTDVRGDLRWLEEDATNLCDDPDVGYVVGNIRDITDRKRAQQQLAMLALHDPLTGLANRSLVVNRLEQLLTRGTAAAVLYIDLDNFREVNDALGHAAGDDLLRLVGWRLASAVAGVPSTLARVGGDEFVLLCDGVRDATAAFSYAERLRNSLELPFDLDGNELFVAASIGVALSPGDASGLMRDAGIATHQAKQLGRDRVTMFEARLDSAQRRRLALQSELHHALERDELVVWYQPIMDLATNQVAGVEALVRWDHPVHGILLPEEFIEIADTSGLIRKLGSQVLRKACTDAAAWREQGIRLRVSVNAAVAQLNRPDYVAEIAECLREFGLEPEQMTIEITETAAMQVAETIEALNRIRALGLHLALDDFGTGYSSLSFLRELPVDAIKIDRSFVSGLGTSDRDFSIVQGVVAIAAALGHAVVAEGIETTAQVDALRRLGCRYAQGFLWSRAVPAAAITKLARELG